MGSGNKDTELEKPTNQQLKPTTEGAETDLQGMDCVSQKEEVWSPHLTDEDSATLR